MDRVSVDEAAGATGIGENLLSYSAGLKRADISTTVPVRICLEMVWNGSDCSSCDILVCWCLVPLLSSVLTPVSGELTGQTGEPNGVAYLNIGREGPFGPGAFRMLYEKLSDLHQNLEAYLVLVELRNCALDKY